MQSVTFDRDFTQPPERMFAYLADHKNLEPLFEAKIARLTEGDDGVPNGPGACTPTTLRQVIARAALSPAGGPAQPVGQSASAAVDRRVSGGRLGALVRPRRQPRRRAGRTG